MESMVLDRDVPGVLIVDDIALVRSFLRTALEATARVVEAEDAERALDILEERARDTVDLVLLDYVLPKRSGLELLKITKLNWPWISVVILTGLGSEDVAVQAFRQGASDYLRKPIAVDALRQTVAAVLRCAESEPRGARHSGNRSVQPRAVHPNIHQALAFMHAHFAEADLPR